MLNPSISYGIHQFGGLHMPSTSTMTLLNMDSSDSISYKQKSNEDIISNLPDVIIGHILSLLPTRDAVRTCVLSKRWIYMWTFITKLDFNDQEQFKYRNYIRKKSFLNSVYRVLLHLNSSTIESISLSLSENYGPYHVNEWISALLTRRVKEICIDSKEKFDISSHSPLWKSRFLEKLIVDMNTNLTSIRWTAQCDIRVIVPNFVYLLSLTVLNLSGITLSCVPSNDLQKLSLNFPALRKYETVNCTWLNVKSVTIEVPVLEVPVLEVLIIKDTSVFRSDASYSVIKFCASQLAEFSYSGYMSDAISFDISVARIASANIYPRKCKEMSEVLKWSFGYHFLRMFNNKVTCLKFEQPQVLALGVICCRNLPQFEMLSHLELDKVIGSMLWFFLLKSPFIETFTLKELLSFDHRSNLNVVPPCVASKFKVVKFERFNGDEHELHFAKFVIEKAQVLKRVSFTPVGNLCGSKFEEVKEKIFSFKESVSSAVIEFLY